MNENDRVLWVVREWVQKAENDLKNAANTLKMGEDCPTDTVCFHAQQCVENCWGRCFRKGFMAAG